MKILLCRHFLHRFLPLQIERHVRARTARQLADSAKLPESPQSLPVLAGVDVNYFSLV